MIPASPTRADIEGRLKDYMADYDADAGASLSFFNAIQDLRFLLTELARVEARSYAHMCRDGHEQIGHNDSEHEMCPLCRALARFEDMARRVKEIVKGIQIVADTEEPSTAFARVVSRRASEALLALQTETHDGK